MAYPRVTEILGPFSEYKHVPQQILEKAAARGTTVHSLCAGIARDNWIPDSMIAENLLGYVNSFRKWADAVVSQFVIVEKRFYEDDLGYSGQVDLVILSHDKELYLVDIKTSSQPRKTYPIQMAAYEHLLQKNNVMVKGAMLVYLDADGNFPTVFILEHLEPEYAIFLCALNCWHYFNKGKKNVGKNTNDTDDTPDDSATTGDDAT